MLSVGDIGDMFVPILEGFLVEAEESGPVLEALLQQLPTMFAENQHTEIILLPAVQVRQNNRRNLISLTTFRITKQYMFVLWEYLFRSPLYTLYSM